MHPVLGQIANHSEGDLVEITTTDGQNIRGTIIGSRPGSVIIETVSLGQITLDIKSIRQLTIISQANTDPDANPTDFHNSTRYFVNPSGYNLNKGQAYYENIGIFFNSVTFGVSDNFSISFGGEIASLLFASRFPVLYISPKFSVPFGNEQGAFGVGATFFTAPEEEFIGFGVIQAAITGGSRNNNISAGAGIGFSTEDGFTDSVIPFSLSGMTRLSKKISLVSDNFFVAYDDFSDSFGFLSIGLRIHFKRPGAAFNASLWRPTEGLDELIALPFVSATIPLR